MAARLWQAASIVPVSAAAPSSFRSTPRPSRVRPPRPDDCSNSDLRLGSKFHAPARLAVDRRDRRSRQRADRILRERTAPPPFDPPALFPSGALFFAPPYHG